MGCARRGGIRAILTRRASEGPRAFPSLARRVGIGCMQSDREAARVPHSPDAYTVAPSAATLTRRASEGPSAFPSLARRVGIRCMQSDRESLQVH